MRIGRTGPIHGGSLPWAGRRPPPRTRARFRGPLHVAVLAVLTRGAQPSREGDDLRGAASSGLLREVETRELHLGAGFPGLSEYCRSLGLSEGEAWRRIQAARMARKFPEVLESLAAGRLHLSGVSSLAKVMSEENAAWLLGRVAGMTKREIEAVVADLLVPDVSPQLAMDFGEREPIGPSLPGGNDGDVTPDAPPKRYAPEPARAPSMSPRSFSPRVRAAFEAYRALVDQTGDADDVDGLLVRALETATAVEEKRRFGTKAAKAETAVATPDRSPVPKPVRRAVYDRDEVRCTFTSPDGVRCNTRHRLQLHHRVAVAHGGLNTPDNLTLHCGPHNRYQAQLDGLPRPSREGIPQPIHQS